MNPTTPNGQNGGYKALTRTGRHQKMPSQPTANGNHSSSYVDRRVSAPGMNLGLANGAAFDLETPPHTTGGIQYSVGVMPHHTEMVDCVVGPESYFIHSSDPNEDGKVFDVVPEKTNTTTKVPAANRHKALEASALVEHPFESALYPPVFSSTAGSSSSQTDWSARLLKPLGNGKLSFTEHSQRKKYSFTSSPPYSNHQSSISSFEDEPQSRNVFALVTPHRRQTFSEIDAYAESTGAAAFATPSRKSLGLTRKMASTSLNEVIESPILEQASLNSRSITDSERDLHKHGVTTSIQQEPATPVKTVTADVKVKINGVEVTDANAQKLLPAEYCLFAGNLPLFSSVEQLRAQIKSVVGRFGPVFVQTHQDSSGRPYAHLQFTNMEDKMAFFEHHVTNHLMIEGRPLRLEETKAPRSVYVRTLNGSPIDIQEVKEYLNSIGGTMVDAFLPNLNEVVGGSFSRADGLVFKFKNYGEYLNVRKTLKDKHHPKYEFMFTPQQMSMRSQTPKEKPNKARSSCLVFVGNIDQNVASVERLHGFFSHWGRIRNINIVPNPHVRLPNPHEPAPTHAWIDFLNLSDAYRAVDESNMMMFFGRPIIVQPRMLAKGSHSIIDRALNMLYSVAPDPLAITQSPHLGFGFHGRFYAF